MGRLSKDVTQSEADQAGRRVDFEAGVAAEHGKAATRADKAGDRDLADTYRELEAAANARASRFHR